MVPDPLYQIHVLVLLSSTNDMFYLEYITIGNSHHSTAYIFTTAIIIYAFVPGIILENDSKPYYKHWNQSTLAYQRFLLKKVINVAQIHQRRTEKKCVCQTLVYKLYKYLHCKGIFWHTLLWPWSLLTQLQATNNNILTYGNSIPWTKGQNMFSFIFSLII